MVANLLVAAVAVLAHTLHQWDSRLFYRVVQEDGAVEWTTFWAFLVAAVLAFLGARQQRISGLRLPWFSFGIGLFCFVVAMEEISWGQRLFGYRPPEYFLAENFQQELNLHNIVSTAWRKRGLMIVVFGYGIALPILALVPKIGRIFDRLAVTSTPPTLIPAFSVTLLLYQIYPWRFTGEVVELMLGFCFLFASLLPRYSRSTDGSAHLGDRVLGPVVATLLLVSLGTVTAATLYATTRHDLSRVEVARREVEALSQDFQTLTPLRCQTHKRVYGYKKKYDASGLDSGTFAALRSHGLPEERGFYYLDPWNSPYWVRHRCDDGKTTLLAIYSFGPNRRRDSTALEILGDDIVAVYRPAD